MNQQVVLVDPTGLDEIANELRRLHQRLDAIEMQPRPEWVTVPQYAQMIGRSVATVNRRIRDGKLDVKDESGTRMVRVNQGV